MSRLVDMEMFIVLILVVGPGWAAGGPTSGSCSPEALLACTNIIASTASHQAALRMYSKPELDSLCSHEFVAVQKCLQPVKADCDVSVAVVFDAFVDTLQFMCSDVGKQGYVDHGECLKQRSIQTALHQCFTSHQQRSRATTASAHDYATIMCGLNVEYAGCLQGAVEPGCGTPAAAWVQAMSAAYHKAVNAMLHCEQVMQTETPAIAIRRMTQVDREGFSVEPLTPEPRTDCKWEELHSCMKPWMQISPTSGIPQQLTDKTLDNMCRWDVGRYEQCQVKVGPHCSPAQTQHMAATLTALTAACHLYTTGGRGHRKCWRQDAVQAAMTVCAHIHHLAGGVGSTGSGEEGSGGSGDVPYRDRCRSTQAYLDCIVEATEAFCPSHTGRWIWRTLELLLQPSSTHLRCIFRYHPRVKPSFAAIIPTVTSPKPIMTSSTATVTSSTTIITSSTPMTTSVIDLKTSSLPMRTSSMPTITSSTRSVTSSMPSKMPSTLIDISSTPSITSTMPRMTLPIPSLISSTPSAKTSSPNTRSSITVTRKSSPKTTSSTASMTTSTASMTTSTASMTSSTPSMTSSTFSVTSSMHSTRSLSDSATPTHVSEPNMGSVAESPGWSIAFGGAVGVGTVLLLAGVVCGSVVVCQRLFKRRLSGDTESVLSLPSNCESTACSEHSATVTHADYCQARDGSVMLTIPQFSF